MQEPEKLKFYMDEIHKYLDQLTHEVRGKRTQDKMLTLLYVQDVMREVEMLFWKIKNITSIIRDKHD